MSKKYLDDLYYLRQDVLNQWNKAKEVKTYEESSYKVQVAIDKAKEELLEDYYGEVDNMIQSYVDLHSGRRGL